MSHAPQPYSFWSVHLHSTEWWVQIFVQFSLKTRTFSDLEPPYSLTSFILCSSFIVIHQPSSCVLPSLWYTNHHPVFFLHCDTPTIILCSSFNVIHQPSSVLPSLWYTNHHPVFFLHCGTPTIILCSAFIVIHQPSSCVLPSLWYTNQVSHSCKTTGKIIVLCILITTLHAWLTNWTILHKNPTNALMYVNTTLLTLLHCYMFRHSRGHPHGVPVLFLSWINKICV